VAIRFKCFCGKTLACPEEYAGRRARCKGCGNEIEVPGNTIIQGDFSEVTSVVEAVRALTDSAQSDRVVAAPTTAPIPSTGVDSPALRPVLAAPSFQADDLAAQPTPQSLPPVPPVLPLLGTQSRPRRVASSKTWVLILLALLSLISINIGVLAPCYVLIERRVEDRFDARLQAHLSETKQEQSLFLLKIAALAEQKREEVRNKPDPPKNDPPRAPPPPDIRPAVPKHVPEKPKADDPVVAKSHATAPPIKIKQISAGDNDPFLFQGQGYRITCTSTKGVTINLV
jgi:hypothetical protein